MAIQSCIKRSDPKVFRRVYMKRRQSGGEYETDWQQIPDHRIMGFGSVSRGIDDIKVNWYSYSGLSLKFQNNDGYFSDETDDKSFFYGYMTRYRTLVKIEAGYVDADGTTELPTTAAQYIGLIDEDMKYQQDNIISFKTNHISTIFQEFPADRITGLGATQTASDIITKIRDYQDAGATKYFQKYISLGAWSIAATTQNYNMGTTTTLQGMSCWEFMKKLAEAENKLMYVSRDGNFNFVAKTAVSATVYHFSGVGDDDKTYGRNILKQISVDENIRQVYNRVEITYDTNSSLYVRNETWQWGDSSSSFYFGVRKYQYENAFMGSTVATSIADTIYNEFKWPKQLVRLETKFVPHLELRDEVTLTYKTTVYSGEALWDHATYGISLWGERSGKNINIDNVEYKIEKISHDFDHFKSNLELKEI